MIVAIAIFGFLLAVLIILPLFSNLFSYRRYYDEAPGYYYPPPTQSYYRPDYEYHYRREQTSRTMATIVFLVCIMGLILYFKASDKEPSGSKVTHHQIEQDESLVIQ